MCMYVCPCMCLPALCLGGCLLMPCHAMPCLAGWVLAWAGRHTWAWVDWMGWRWEVGKGEILLFLPSMPYSSCHPYHAMPVWEEGRCLHSCLPTRRVGRVPNFSLPLMPSCLPHHLPHHLLCLLPSLSLTTTYYLLSSLPACLPLLSLSHLWPLGDGRHSSISPIQSLLLLSSPPWEWWEWGVW